jgi:hypothetical protein
MQLAHPLDTVGDPTFAEDLSGLVHHTDVVMVLSPIHTNENHSCSSLPALLASPEECSGDLMD